MKQVCPTLYILYPSPRVGQLSQNRKQGGERGKSNMTLTQRESQAQIGPFADSVRPCQEQSPQGRSKRKAPQFQPYLIDISPSLPVTETVLSTAYGEALSAEPGCALRPDQWP